MIYAPQLVFNVQLSLLESFINAVARALVDLIRQEGRSWEYYVGLGLGGAALTTGIPGAQAVMYAAGSGVLELFLETSPGAAQARIFLDGVLDADLDLADEAIDLVTHIINIPDDLQSHVITIQNLGSLDPEDATDWLSILGVRFNTGLVYPKGVLGMAIVNFSFTIRDIKTVSTARVKNKQSFSVYVPLGTLTLAELTGYHDALATRLDAVTGGVIEASSFTLQPVLPGGLKATAEAGSDVQEGANLTFDLESGYAESVRVPALKAALFGADGQSVITTAAGVVDNLVQLLLGTVANPLDIPGSDKNGLPFQTLRAAKKSFRK